LLFPGLSNEAKIVCIQLTFAYSIYSKIIESIILTISWYHYVYVYFVSWHFGVSRVP